MRDLVDSGPLVAVVDDDQPLRVLIGEILGQRGYRTQLFERAEAALAWPRLGQVDCLLSDVKMPGLDGEALLEALGRREAAPPVVMITAHGDVAMAVRTLRAGAYDFLEKPFDEELLVASVARAVERSMLRREASALRRRVATASDDVTGRYGLVGRSEAMRAVFERIGTLAGSDAPVLIYGETGVGKELVARAVHAESPRARGPFVAVNAGALPEGLLESELFGHARGAFTGAVAQRHGKLVAASSGTLLLDELESLSLRAQVQLLRVLEDGLVVQVGDDRPRPVDVRLISTSKVDLRDHVRQGKMRQDFYHRIVVLSINVPPLRERMDDLPLLIEHHLRGWALRTGRPVPDLPAATYAAMRNHAWRGNVRELKNTLERMLVTASHGRMGEFAPDEQLGGRPGRLLSPPATAGWLRDALEQTERDTIAEALEQARGEVSAAARRLGISRRALYERLKRYNIDRADYRS